MTLSDLTRYLRPLVTRVGNLVASATLSGVDDGTKMQSVQVDFGDDEVRDEVERPQSYGLTSVPFEGADATVVCVGGRRDHCIVLAVDDRRYRLRGLAQGEVALYTDQGDKIHLKRGGTIEVIASSRVTVNAPLVEVPSGDVTAGGISLRHHKHSAQAMPPNPTTDLKADPTSHLVTGITGEAQ